ncbi:MAG: hypothetical protein ACE5GR_06730 [Nitrosopumilus sp.]
MNRIILFSFVLLLFPVSNSFGAYQSEFGDDVFIFVQTTVRNSDGVLVAYLESSKFTDFNGPAMKSFLDFEASRGNDPVIVVDSQNYEVIRRVQSHTFDSEGLVASTILSDNVDGKNTVLARFAHDGYTVVPGDTLESMWTFVRIVS